MGYQDKLLYLLVFPLHPSLFWELRDKRNFIKKNAILFQKYRTWPIEERQGRKKEAHYAYL